MVEDEEGGGRRDAVAAGEILSAFFGTRGGPSSRGLASVGSGCDGVGSAGLETSYAWSSKSLSLSTTGE